MKNPYSISDTVDWRENTFGPHPQPFSQDGRRGPESPLSHPGRGAGGEGARAPSPPSDLPPDSVAEAGEGSLTEYHPASHGHLVSYSEPAGDVDAADFLRAGQGRERTYWRDGRAGSAKGGITLAGIGVAADLMGWGETRFQAIERQARDLFSHAVVAQEKTLIGGLSVDLLEEPLAAPKLFGGFAFREDFVPDQTWFGFNPAHFVLPHYQYTCHDEQAWLTINALLPEDETVEETLPALQAALRKFRDSLGGTGTPCRARTAEYHLTYPLTFDDWAQMIDAALAEFQAGTLDKVVLARVCEARAAGEVDIDGALAFLQARYPDCYTFLFEPRPGFAFFGATPELLIQTHGRDFASMSLAGSAPRGQTPDEDAALAEALLHSEKDRREHALVVDAMRRRLEPLAEELTIPAQPAIYQLSNIQHLHTPVRGTLRGEVAERGVLPLVEQLHPTPALGGSPRERALAFIRQHEPVPRGWYAAPIGWIDASLDGAFGVAIRSAVAQRRRVWLYAGCGVVEGSEAEKEWAETGWKFRPVQDALGV